MKSIGIDIGSYMIKVVEINSSSSKNYQINQFYTHPLSMNPNSDKHIEIIEFLRTISAKYDPTQTQFIVGLRQDKVAVRSKTFPFNDRNKINRTLPLELEEEIPFNTDNAIFDFKIQNFPTPNSSEILAFAVKKEEIQKTIQLLKESGIQIDILSTEGSAFANLFEKWNDPITFIGGLPTNRSSSTTIENEIDKIDPNLESTVITKNRILNVVLNIGHSQTLLTAYENNKLIAVRNILWGGKNIGEMVAKKYNLPLSEAHKEIELKGFILTKKQEISPESKAFSDMIARGFRDLVKDVQISILELKSEFGADVVKIDLTGGMSLIQGVGPYMTQFLEIPCNRLNVLDGFSQVYFEKNDINDARLSVALGLAIEGLKKPRNPAINFLKNEFAKKDDSFKKFWTEWGLTAQISFVFIVILYVWSFLRIDFSTSLALAADENLKQVAKQNIGLSTKNASQKNIKKYITEHKKIISDMKTAEKFYQLNSALDILKKVSDHSPNKTQIKLDVKKINIEDQLVSIEGYVNSPLEKEQLQEFLKGFSSDEKIQTQSTQLPNILNRVIFSFSFNVDRGLDRETR